ncbi:LmbU family transcriptional regulator [Streptomyces sp. NPDC047525]|uniref:LmbU family transcriptional regulator n=1 Tax=Streptomyces sp. NPDC047525 TaxID=3155264 RepID=UPI0033C35E70
MSGDSSVRTHTYETSKSANWGNHPRPTFDPSTLVTRRGLIFPERMAFDKWVGVGSYLSHVISASAWCLGDWLVYGEARFHGRYRDAIEFTSLDYQTLRNHAWVARHFPMSRRRDRVSFTHHAEVAALVEPEQDAWLRKAEEQGWSVKRLRREVKASLQERSAGDETPGRSRNDRGLAKGRGQEEEAVGPQSEGTVLLRVSVSADCLEFCQATARRFGLNVETWAARILVEATSATDEGGCPAAAAVQLE